ncbi:unnamed protein product [Leptidea sinapis]|uniref:Uncharacterized protein n=1 Tax=Leptidea sinapis TaxID=189913 RepID=A0A5E4QU87_9NEOP|nr:unnamed protein product [Leptidea sinapis]
MELGAFESRGSLFTCVYVCVNCDVVCVSSDTESAVGRERSRLSALGARVRAALPRARDRVQATEPVPTPDADDKASDEDKKVVYAELVLGDQTAEKPPPPSTEYAEIVYTDQPQVKETKE